MENQTPVKKIRLAKQASLIKASQKVQIPMKKASLRIFQMQR